MESVRKPIKLEDGSWVWTVKGKGCAAIIRKDGSSHVSCSPGHSPSEAFLAVVYALAEWYKTDEEEYGGLNALKVESEL